MSGAAKQTIVAFQSDFFDMSATMLNVMNPGHVGEDVCSWIIDKLHTAGHDTEPVPRDEDFGWHVNFVVEGHPLSAVVGQVYGECWFVMVETRRGLVGSLFGGRHRGVPIAGVLAVRDAVALIPDVRRLRWYSAREFNSRDWLQQSGALSPDAH